MWTKNAISHDFKRFFIFASKKKLFIYFLFFVQILWKIQNSKAFFFCFLLSSALFCKGEKETVGGFTEIYEQYTIGNELNGVYQFSLMSEKFFFVSFSPFPCEILPLLRAENEKHRIMNNCSRFFKKVFCGNCFSHAENTEWSQFGNCCC